MESAGEKIPRIHDLEKLYGLNEKIYKNLKINEDILAQINDVYIDIRYPADSGLIPDGVPSIKKVSEFHKATEEIYKNIVLIAERNTERK